MTAEGVIPLTYVCSDVHGCYDKYKAMLEEIHFKAADTLYVLGDVIDRGPDGVKILHDMMVRPNVIPILGNHEFTAAVCLLWLIEEITEESLDSLGDDQLAAFNEWVLNGGGPTLEALTRLDRNERVEILEYIQEMALYAEVRVQGRSFVLAHAGLENFVPGKPLDTYTLDDFLFGSPRLDQARFEDKILIFGHTPTRLLRKQAGIFPYDTILRKGNQIAIDCGCSFGGKLGCLCLETMDEFYV